MTATSVLLVLLGLTGTILAWHGIIMLSLLGIYIGYSYWVEKYKKAFSCLLT